MATTSFAADRGRPGLALPRPTHGLAELGPGWFTTVMGTGIVANAAALLPVHAAALDDLALAAWLLASALLLVLGGAAVARLGRLGAVARTHALDPALAPAFGAPPMALLTVGAGALLIGHRVVGTDAALALDGALWTAGTLSGLAVCVGVPLLMVTRHELRPAMASGTWLLPVVPPMVSAATGAALVAHLPAGQARLTLLLACGALFGTSLLAGLLTIALLWSRLLLVGPGAPAQAPTTWIALGVLGQSVTAANGLAAAATAAGVAPAADAGVLRLLGVAYGLPVWGFAMLWLALAGALTARTARGGLPPSHAFWSFTFPVGTCVTGTAALARATGADVLTWAAVALFAVLLAGWLAAARATVARPGLGAPRHALPGR